MCFHTGEVQYLPAAAPHPCAATQPPMLPAGPGPLPHSCCFFFSLRKRQLLDKYRVRYREASKLAQYIKEALDLRLR